MSASNHLQLLQTLQLVRHLTDGQLGAMQRVTSSTYSGIQLNRIRITKNLPFKSITPLAREIEQLSPSINPFQQSFSSQTRSYFSRAAAFLAALGITAWLAAYLPSLALAVLMVGYAVFSTIGALHFTVIKRLHKQYKLEEEGNLSRLNRKWVLTLAVLFILSLVSAFVFVLESPKWDALEWVFTICGVPLYFLVFIFTQRHLKKEYAPKFDRAKAMRVSFWVVGVILCLGYAVVSLFVAAPESNITLQSTLEATPNSFAYSPSALMSDTGKLSSFVDALVAFGMTKASGLSIAVAFICRFVIYAAVFFGLVNLFNFCLLSNDEIRAEFQPLMIDREEIALRTDTQKIHRHHRRIVHRFYSSLPVCEHRN